MLFSRFGHIFKVFLLRGGGVFFSFILHPVLAKKLSQADYGAFVFYQGLFNIFGMILQFGLSKIIIREYGQRYSTSELLKKYFGFQLILFSLSNLVLWTFFSSYESVDVIFQVILISILLASVVIVGSVLRGKMNINLAVTLENIVPNAVVLAGIIAFGAFGLNWNVLNVLKLNSLGFGLALLLSLLFLLKGKANEEVKHLNMSLLLKSGFYIICIELVFIAYSQGLVAYSKLIDTFEMLAFLGVAVKLSDLILLPSRFLTSYVDPQLSKLIHHGDRSDVERFAQNYTGISAIIAFVGLIAFVGFGGWILKFGFGPSYIEAYSLLLILAVSKFLGSVIAGYAQSLIIMHNFEKKLWVLEVKSVVVLITATVVLGYFYGVLGVSWGYFIGSIYRFILLKNMSQNLLNINPSFDMNFMKKIIK